MIMGWAMALVPFTLLALGMPIFLILLVTVIVLLAFFLNIPFTVIPQTMFGSIDTFALLAVPFFIFAGEVMGQGGISERLIRWVQSMFGSVRDSLALALTTVGTCEFFGAISGSSPATVAAVGRIMYPALRGAAAIHVGRDECNLLALKACISRDTEQRLSALPGHRAVCRHHFDEDQQRPGWPQINQEDVREVTSRLDTKP